MKTEVKNATITSTQLGHIYNGCILSCFVNVEGEGWGCGFGGYCFDKPDNTRKAFERIGTAYGMEFISRVLKVVGVEQWENLKGKNVRVDCEGLGGGILGIGHIKKDQWFYPKRDLAHMMNESTPGGTR